MTKNPHVMDAGDLLTGPVLATREGCRRRIACCSLGQWARIAQGLGVPLDQIEPERLALGLWARNKGRSEPY